jgi:hypothetical protein
MLPCIITARTLEFDKPIILCLSSRHVTVGARTGGGAEDPTGSCGEITLGAIFILGFVYGILGLVSATVDPAAVT